MPQPISNTQTIVSGSLLANQISYVVDGQGRNYRGGFGGLSWMSEVQAENNVIFIGNTTSIGRGPANSPLFYPAFNNTDANITYAVNNLPGSPGDFLTSTRAYNWAATNNFFINNSDNPIPKINADGMVLYLDANQPTSYPTTGTSWYDLSGNATIFTLYNNPIWNPGGWIEFDGTDDSADTNASILRVGGSDTYTFDFLVNIADNSANQTIMYNGTLSSTGFWFFKHRSGLGNRLVFHGYDGVNPRVDVLSSDVVPNAKWTRVGITYNGTTYQIYINGLVNGSPVTDNAIAPTTSTTNLGGGGAVGRLNGNIALGYVYKKALTPTEILQNYYQAPIVTDGLIFAADAANLVSYESGSTTAYSLTGSFGGTLTNGVGFDSANGGNWTFDGVNDNIKFPSFFHQSQNLSYECWVNPSLEMNDAMAVYYGQASSSRTYRLYRNSSFTTNQLGFLAYYTNTSATIKSTNIRHIFQPNTWTHTVHTLDDEGIARVYINGGLAYTQDKSSTYVEWSTPNGYLKLGGTNYFPGSIAKFQAYDTALTADEVQQNYEATKGKFLGQQIVENGLVLNLDAADRDSYARTLPPLEVLVVAGGGAGGSGGGTVSGGGGGAGGVIYNSAYQLTNAAALTVTIGAGGAGGTGERVGLQGSNSSAFGLTAIGGGGAGGNSSQDLAQQSGGSGGGGRESSGDGGTGTAGQGFNGGAGNEGANYAGGGGGAGQPGNTNGNGWGGNGLAFSISGTSTYYGGGGSSMGAANSEVADPGLGGGGKGRYQADGDDGVVNTGGGGGGCGSAYTSGDGGSGIVIIRYSGPQAATGGTVVSANGYTTHTFTSSGTFTPALWNDLSGNNNNGTLVNGVTWNPSLSGGVMGFDGVDDYIQLNNRVIPATGAFSMEFLYQIDTIGGRGGMFERNPSAPYNGALIGQGGSNNWAFQVNNGSQNLTLNSPYPTTNTWYHDVGTYDGVNTIWFYRNGVLLGTQTSATIGNIDSAGVRDNLRLMRRDSNSSVIGGKVAICRVYPKALSATEITQNYNATKGRFGL